MVKVFIDANVWIAGAASPKGGARRILDWGEEKLVQVFTSQQAFQEARNNVIKKLPRALPAFERLIKATNPRVVRQPSQRRIVEVEKLIHPKDAPILAAAIKGNVDYFVTLDKRHFMKPSVQKAVSFPILLPDEFVKIVAPQLEREE